MAHPIQLLMISAMYENGGNTTHRFFDGHPELFVYPFESQIGTKFVKDELTSMFPVKYRWPAFILDATPEQDYHAIIDEECKVRARTPHVSKFRDFTFDFSDHERLLHYVDRTSTRMRSTAGNVEGFFWATFQAWRNHSRTGRERVYVGYSPIIVVDAGTILSQMTDAHVLHVVRNPWSAYADTKKRPVPLSLSNYMMLWSLTQYFAVLNKELYPQRLHIVRLEDLLVSPSKALAGVCSALGIGPSAALDTPSWNGEPLKQVYPWGTIREATPAANRATATELTVQEQLAVRHYAGAYLDSFQYSTFLDT